MSSLLFDFRYALRTLARAPGFTALAVLCLGLGIGANTTVFSAVNTLLLRDLPYGDADRLAIVHTAELARPDQEGSWSYPNFKDFSTADGAFTHVGAYTQRQVNLAGADEPLRIPAARVSSNLVETLGLRPILGRSFRNDEELEGKVAILSHGLWRSSFGGDSGVLGRTVRVNDRPYTIIGVMGPKLRFPERAEMWLPLEPGEFARHRDWNTFELIGRVADGLTIEQANQRVAATFTRLRERFPVENRNVTAWARPYRELFVDDVRPVLFVMLGAVGFVLLIACANVANLLLARATARQREIAVRVSLGASRMRITRQLLVESLLLALLGGTLGVLIGTWGMDAIKGMLPPDLPFWMEFDVDRPVLVFTVLISLATSVVFGLVPALQASALSLTDTLKDGGRGATAGTRAGKLRGSLVVVQVAISMVLLVGASLMIKSFLKLQTVDPGFRRESVLTLGTSIAGPRFESDSSAVQFYDQLLERVAAVPGVTGAGIVGNLPIRNCCNSTRYYVEGTTAEPNTGPFTLLNTASPGFFHVMGIRLIAGRYFTKADAEGREPVAIIARSLAEQAWPGANPLGRRLSLGHPSDSNSVMVTVVGVIPDVKQRELNEASSAQVWLPHAQNAWRSVSVVVRTAGPPATMAGAIRAAIRAVDPNLPVTEVNTMQEVVNQRMFESRVDSSMFTAFGIAALLLATIGLYGVLSYLVAQRTHEFGLRMALGAEARDVIRMVVRDGARLVGIGLAIGIPASIGLSEALRGALYGVSPRDPGAILTVTVVFAIVAYVAALIPARRATHVDPIVALRAD